MNNPKFLPAGWPSDKRSRLNTVTGQYVLYHPERTPMAWINDKWQDYKVSEPKTISA